MSDLVECPRCKQWASAYCYLCTESWPGQVPAALSVEYVLLGYDGRCKPTERSVRLMDLRKLRERHGLEG